MNRRRSARSPLLLAASIAATAPGCGGPAEDSVVVATSWTEADCRRIEAEFAAWSRRPEEAADRPTRLSWVRLSPWDDPARRAARLRGVDLILGGPVGSYRRLDAEVLRPTEGRSSRGIARSRPAGAAAKEGVAVLREARDPGRSAAILRFLSTGEDPEADSGSEIVDSFADLLNSALDEPREESRAAWRDAIRQMSTSSKPAFQPPPWPPEIVTRLRSAEGSASLLETLAAQIAPNPNDRAWLLESWDRPPRPVDAGLLKELAGVGGGRLIGDERFRAWLRSEWRGRARGDDSKPRRSAGAGRA